MAAGFDLKEGEYDQTLRSSNEIQEVLAQFLVNKSRKASTYKYAMFKSIMDCLHLAKNKTYKLSFDLLFSRFAEIYWVLVFNYNIPQKELSITASKTLAEQIVLELAGTYKIQNRMEYDELPDSIRFELVNQMKKRCTRYVFGALYAETYRVLYSFSKEKEWIMVNPQIVDFLKINEDEIQKQNYKAWGDYYVEIGVNNGKESIYFQRLLKREFGNNRVLLITQPTPTKKSLVKQRITGEKDEAEIVQNLRMMLSKYPDLGLYLAQFCDKLNYERDEVKQILENSFWCRKVGSRYYYNNDSDVDLIEKVLFEEEIVNDDEPAGNIIQESDLEVNPEYFKLLSDPEELIKKLKREKGIVKQGDREKKQQLTITAKQRNIKVNKSSKKPSAAEWDREEVIIIVADYYRTKNMPFIDIMASQKRVSEFLRKRREHITGETVDDSFRSAASIFKQYSKLRGVDPEIGYSKMQGTKLQKRVMKEYIENPEKFDKEAAAIYKKYNWNTECS